MVNAEHVQVVFVFKLITGSPKLLYILLCCPRKNQTMPLQIQFLFQILSVIL